MTIDPQIAQAIMARIHGGGQGGPPPGMGGPPGGPDQGYGPPQPPGDSPDRAGGPRDPLEATKATIQDVHSLIATLPDPAHTQMATQALAILTKIQRDLMGTKSSAAQQGVM